MGLQKSDKIVFLKISDGKIRQKTTKDDPHAEERFDSINNKFLYERVYTACQGYLIDIKVNTHEEYGTQYNLILFDPADGTKYSLGISEESRYFQSMVMLLPNVDLSKPLTVKPFAFKNNGSSNIGLTFEQDGEKIPNYYKDWNEKKQESKLKNGLEKFDFKSVYGDKEETKIMQMKLRKFLKSELKKQIQRLYDYIEANGAKYNTAENSDSDYNAKDDNDEDNSNDKKRTVKSKTSVKPSAKKKQSSKSDDDDESLPY